MSRKLIAPELFYVCNVSEGRGIAFCGVGFWLSCCSPAFSLPVMTSILDIPCAFSTKTVQKRQKTSYCPRRDYYWISSGKGGPSKLLRPFTWINSCQPDSSTLSCKRSKDRKLLEIVIHSLRGLSRNKISDFSEVKSWKHFSGSAIILVNRPAPSRRRLGLPLPLPRAEKHPKRPPRKAVRNKTAATACRGEEVQNAKVRRVSGERLESVFGLSPRLSGDFWGQTAGGPGDIFETFSEFLARRARGTPVRSQGHCFIWYQPAQSLGSRPQFGSFPDSPNCRSCLGNNRATANRGDANQGERQSRASADDGTMTLCPLRTATVPSRRCCVRFDTPPTEGVVVALAWRYDVSPHPACRHRTSHPRVDYPPPIEDRNLLK